MYDKKQLDKQVINYHHYYPEIDENKELTVKIATKDDITEMVKYHKTKKVFEPQYFGGKNRGECEIIFLFIQ